jgi:ABC-2 type transport system permease protein
MWERIREIVRKELRQTLREPRMRGILIGPPLIQLIVFGFAVNLDVENSAIAWMDQDSTPASRELRSRFTASRYFQVVEEPASDLEAQEALDHGRARAVVRVLPGFARDIARGRATPVQILLDGTNSNTAAIAGGQASAIVNGYAAELLRGRMREKLVAATTASGGPVTFAIPTVNVRSRVWFNPELKSRVYFVPGFTDEDGLSCWGDDVLDTMGYAARYSLINSAHHGVPQMRDRVFMIAFQDRKSTRLNSSH